MSDAEPDSDDSNKLLLILGNQLFPIARVRDTGINQIFMAEDLGLCTYTRHHKLKIVLFLAAMRYFADDLDDQGFDVSYDRLDEQLEASGKPPSYEQKLTEYLEENEHIDELVHFEIEDKFFEHRIATFCGKHKLKRTELPSPMFLTSRQQFAEYLDDANGKPFMARFYERQRKRLNILVDKEGKPKGGQWSFDADNRKKLPKDVRIPKMNYANPTEHVHDVVALVNEYFADHPGQIEDVEESVWFPTTRRQALAWLTDFLDYRLEKFGDYEDALSDRGDWLFHSVLTPTLNLGLITPDEIIERTLRQAKRKGTPMNSLEGFVRQIIGWREFIRGIYQNYSDVEESENSFNHHRKMKACWFTGETGMPPLDDAIKKAIRLGWTHHIERLMVLSNFMNLCEIEPKQAHDWFMQMFIDSSDWVMGPNVYGMGLRSDGGIFSTKPYICGSNYLLKMSDYSKGDWCDAADGLYWRFVENNKAFFESNPRMSMMTRSLAKLKSERKEKIFAAAERFIDHVTEQG